VSSRRNDQTIGELSSRQCPVGSVHPGVGWICGAGRICGFGFPALETAACTVAARIILCVDHVDKVIWRLGMLTADPPCTPKYLVNISADPHFQINLSSSLCKASINKPTSSNHLRMSAISLTDLPCNPASTFMQIRRFYNSSTQPACIKQPRRSALHA